MSLSLAQWLVYLQTVQSDLARGGQLIPDARALRHEINAIVARCLPALRAAEGDGAASAVWRAVDDAEMALEDAHGLVFHLLEVVEQQGARTDRAPARALREALYPGMASHGPLRIEDLPDADLSACLTDPRVCRWIDLLRDAVPALPAHLTECRRASDRLEDLRTVLRMRFDAGVLSRAEARAECRLFAAHLRVRLAAEAPQNTSVAELLAACDARFSRQASLAQDHRFPPTADVLPALVDVSAFTTGSPLPPAASA
ncbi:MAG: hypothetical protein KC620_03155 [Myxococcales bacterium]|nr:hypothetical protein [Myxococcales bacterium]